jgi:hypothetical protein
MVVAMNFWIQAGNPRSLHEFDPEDESIFDAIQTVFPILTEEAFMIWDRIHIPLGYKYTISFLIQDILLMLEQLMRDVSGELEIHWPSNDFSVIWRMRWDNCHLEIRAEWNAVVGFTESLLASRPMLKIDKSVFICEWKQILGKALKALRDAGYREEHLTDMSKLQRIHDQISEPGILYK